MTTGTGVPRGRRIGTPTMAAYGVGAAAYGIKDAGFGTFLLIFYNQVIGLPPAQVGLVVMLALVLDAMIDPAIGFFSDRTRGRWGRRHPWMYAAALPIAIGWVLLWNPPQGSQTLEMLWLFVMAVIVRSAVSAYEVPSVALTPELSADYDERTRIMAYRYVFGWAGGLAMVWAAYAVFLVPEPGQANGLLNREGYWGYSLAGAIAMASVILISAAGTHHEIKHLPKAAAATTLGHGFRELLETANNRAFALLMLAGLCFYANQGLGFAMSNYLYNYVWRFDEGALAMVAGVLFIGVILAFVGAPRVARRIGKKDAAALAVTCAALLMAAPYVLRLAGLFPEPGSPWMPWTLLAFQSVTVACNVSTAMLGASMMADVVEHSEIETGRRSEGVFFAGAFFIQKCCTGIGIFVAGSMLAIAGLREGSVPGEVPVVVLDRLTMLFAGFYIVMGLLSAWLFRKFPFGRDEHAARVARLAAEMPAGD